MIYTILFCAKRCTLFTELHTSELCSETWVQVDENEAIFSVWVPLFTVSKILEWVAYRLAAAFLCTCSLQYHFISSLICLQLFLTLTRYISWTNTRQLLWYILHDLCNMLSTTLPGRLLAFSTFHFHAHDWINWARSNLKEYNKSPGYVKKREHQKAKSVIMLSYINGL